jgi:hypothetical protein
MRAIGLMFIVLAVLVLFRTAADQASATLATTQLLGGHWTGWTG